MSKDNVSLETIGMEIMNIMAVYLGSFQTDQKIISVNISQKQTGLCKFFAGFT